MRRLPVSFTFIVFILPLFVLISCGDPENIDKAKDDQTTETQNVVGIETLFDETQFSDPIMKELLMELNLCNGEITDTLDYLNPSCSPFFFKFHELSKEVELKNGFMLQLKSKVNGFPLRRLLIFVREQGQLIKVNGFVANLIGRRKSSSGHDDLLLRFNDNEEGEEVFYNCYFQWLKGKYEFLSVEVIEGVNWGGPVKAQFKDSMAVEIKKEITENQMIF
jgi:hypothetical protein